MREQAASLLLRRIRPSLLGEGWAAKNTMLLRGAPTTLQINQRVGTDGDETADSAVPDADVRYMKETFKL